MWRVPWSTLARGALVVSALGTPESHAGAFMAPEGQGQIIVGGGDVVASRTYDAYGHLVRGPVFRKVDVGAYAEYGLTSWLTIVAAPSAARMTAGPSGSSFTGSDASAFGARLRLSSTDSRVVAVQVLMEPPIGVHSVASETMFGGSSRVAAQVRLQFGQTFSVFGWPAFVDLEPGARIRGGASPDEARVDASIGVRPWPVCSILLQSFTSVSPRSGPFIASNAYTKLQLGAVYDLRRDWSIEVGATRTIAGRNAAREFGPLVALWYRF